MSHYFPVAPTNSSEVSLSLRIPARTSFRATFFSIFFQDWAYYHLYFLSLTPFKSKEAFRQRWAAKPTTVQTPRLRHYLRNKLPRQHASVSKFHQKPHFFSTEIILCDKDTTLDYHRGEDSVCENNDYDTMSSYNPQDHHSGSDKRVHSPHQRHR